MKKLIVGVDVSKETLDYCILDPVDQKVMDRGVVYNDSKSILKWLSSFKSSDIALAMEHTGHYGALLAWQLSEHGFDFYMINPLDLKRSLGVHRGKSDTIDAFRIASYTISQRHRLHLFKLPATTLRKLKTLMAARDRFVKISVQCQNSLKALDILSKTLELNDLIKEHKKQIRSVKELIFKIEQQMQELINSDPELKAAYSKICKVTGVGPITATKCIIETNNFTNFTNARKFSCHCGLAPFPYQSGSSINGKTKTHPFRNRDLKATLFKAAGSAIQHDPQLRMYYRRKVKEGKHKLSVLNAVANKLVLRIFAVANREEPFVKLAA